jgi:hypothetical protein
VNISKFIFAGVILLLGACSGGEVAVTGADPAVLEAPIAFVRRPIALDEDGNERHSDLRDPLFFVAGGDLFLRSNSTASAIEINVTGQLTGGQGDVRDLQPHFDGTRLLFSLRLGDENENDDEVPRWNIYEYDLNTRQLHRIIADDLIAEQGDDIDPAYLPDGRIIFSSNRQRQSGEILTNEGKPRFRLLDEDGNNFALLLHVMNADGGELHQVSFNLSHDLDPLVLDRFNSGQILFTRWDNAGARSAMHLYKMNPDGTDLQQHYGLHSHETGANLSGSNDATIQFVEAQEMQDGRLIALARPYRDSFDGGDIVIIDSHNFVNESQPVHAMAGLPGPGQSAATINVVSTETVGEEIPPGGRYRSVYPLWDGTGRFLVSKSQCTILVEQTRRPCIEPWISDPTAQEVSPVYSIWLYDPAQHTQKVVVRAEADTVISDIVALQARSLPDILFDGSTTNAAWRDLEQGALHIRSVYDFGQNAFDGCFFEHCTSAAGISSVNELGDPARASAAQRPARFIRLIRQVAIPSNNDPDFEDAPRLLRSAFGPQRGLGMREIIGYAPVEPDGSVKVLIPANLPLELEVLDAMGRRISPRHLNWFQVRPGETLECTGCHDPDTRDGELPAIHHRRDAEAPSINAGVPASGILANTLIPGTSDAYWGDPGETMAELRFKRAPSEPSINPDLVFEDYWVNPSGPFANTGFSYDYASLDATVPSPASAACIPWDARCRVIINYEQHIHPIWSVTRGALGENTCINCHTATDPVLLIDRVPDAQLDLGDGASDQDNRQFKAYRELLFTDAGQELDPGGQLVNIQIEIPVLDENGDQVIVNGVPQTRFIDDPAARVAASMSSNGARASYFIEKMTETELDARRSLSTSSDPGYVDHSAFLSGHELKLISEWLDLGAQYFNNPFDPDVPAN